MTLEFQLGASRYIDLRVFFLLNVIMLRRFSALGKPLARMQFVPQYGCARNLSEEVSSKQGISSKPEKPLILQKLGIYGELSKFRLSSLVVITSGAGFLATGLPIDWTVLAATCVGTGLCAASANTWNQIREQKFDGNMNRTKARPLPSGRIKAPEAIAWGATAGIVGTGMLLASSNPVVAALGAGNIALYAGPYTSLKRTSEINTWIGSVVGAIPPLMGWAAATGGDLLSADPMFLAGILFLWQFPHFFALSWMHREDYAKGGFQMVAVNDSAATRSGDLVMRYSIYLSTVPIAAYSLGLTSSMFALEGTAANIYLLYLAHKFRQKQSNANARKVFMCSLWYLPLLLASFVFYSKRWEVDDENKEKSQLTDYVARARDYLRGGCVHEIIVNKQNEEGVIDATALCPVIMKDTPVAEIFAKSKDQFREIQDMKSNDATAAK